MQSVHQDLDHNLDAYFALGQGLAGYSYAADPHLAYALSGWHDPFFNTVLHSAYETLQHQRAACVLLEQVLASGVPFRWKVSDAQTALRELLVGHGLCTVDRAWVCAKRLAKLRAVPHGVEQLEVAEVCDADLERGWWEVFSASFGVAAGVPVLDFHRRARRLGGAQFKHVAILRGVRVVACATVFELDGVVALYDFGVRPDEQRQSIGTQALCALERWLLEAGVVRLLWYRTEAGRRLYRGRGGEEYASLDYLGPVR